MERWGAMVAPGRVTSVAVFQHPSLSGKARESLVKAAMAATRENVPFDHQFDAAYTNAFYCTEFVEWLYNGVGLSLLEEKVRRPEFIFPEHCLSKLKQIGMSSTPRRR